MKKMFVSLMLAMGLMVAAQSSAMEMDKDMMRQMVDYSIQKWKLDDGVTVHDAVDSMQLRANLLNFMMVADLPLSEQVEALGEEDVPYMRILAFCDALIANQMVKFDIIFSGFLPCRIAVVEDEEGQGWITTMNMDMMLHAVDLSPELEPMAQHVRDVIYEIVEAGVSGDF
ncbi:DUF302 domain-containing protein [Thioalkalivibrio paradoxus]|uniref:DUF302 domain-containing protein n=1 Tax=Thioalkalivibrio paradoxus ARh 1 TaxID=713585 RepID=W0DMG4_9GAMM|nr:DUF302 domain-containing protein [Thioalkalivibrio paradoxus]AHE99769.1 hypothetical protein THITH_17380 [Thioalkalivibrio paradoxus ARh 1]